MYESSPDKCPYTGAPSPFNRCRVCLSCVSQAAFIPVRTYMDYIGSWGAASYYVQRTEAYEHCVGCHVVKSSKALLIVGTVCLVINFGLLGYGTFGVNTYNMAKGFPRIPVTGAAIFLWIFMGLF